MTPWQLRQAVKCIHQGGVIAYPTEAVFGLGCNPLDFDAVSRICDLKLRSLSKGVILIASKSEQIKPYINPTPALLKRLQEKTARPTTWIVPASPECPRWLTGDHDGVAIRITQHKTCVALCDALAHPLVSTSANPSSLNAAQNPLQVRKYFGNAIDIISHDKTGNQSKPSVIKDALTNKIIRSN